MSAVPPNPPDPSDPPDPQGGDAGRAPGEAQPSPGPFVALGLCIAAAFATTLLFVAFAGTMDLLASRALAVVLGLGSIGALAAVHVPPPHGPRLGFRGLDSGALGATLLLIPVALLTSEVDNLVRAALGASPGFPDAPVERDVVIWLQTLVVFVGIEAILEEWFFRGVVQQGSVDRWGRLRGVLWCGLLYGLYAALGRATSNAEAIAIVAQSAALGATFGALRLATGSLLAPILLHAAINLLAIAGSEWLPIPGFTAPGTHTDPLLLLVAAGSCAAGAALLRDRLQESPPEPPSTDGETGGEPGSEDDEP